MEPVLEALLLGLSLGLVCLASCGAVLVPWLVTQQRAVLATAWLLGQVLAGRLAGYLLFACLAWGAGAVLLPGAVRTRVLVFGVAHLALAATLAWYALGPSRPAWLKRRPAGELTDARAPMRPSRRSVAASVFMRLRHRLVWLGPAALGFLTGVNLCPPFVVATVRAAELSSLPASLAFFTVFFLGTSVWFLPFLAAGAAVRVPEARVIARIAMAVVAAYYGYTGTVAVAWRVFYG